MGETPVPTNLFRPTHNANCRRHRQRRCCSLCGSYLLAAVPSRFRVTLFATPSIRTALNINCTSPPTTTSEKEMCLCNNKKDDRASIVKEPSPNVTVEDDAYYLWAGGGEGQGGRKSADSRGNVGPLLSPPCAYTSPCSPVFPSIFLDLIPGNLPI